MNIRLLPLAALVMLAACDGGTPDETPAEAPAAPADDAGAVAPAPAPPTTSQPAEIAASSDIPAAMRGRWGLVAADCEPGRADAKGLMTVSARKLEFYESVGTLARATEGDRTHLRGVFDFTGEGMSWQRDQSLELTEGGRALVRREFGQDASPEPLQYNKC